MANGGTLSAILGENRGTLGGIIVAAMTVAAGLGSGLSWYFQAEGRAYTDEYVERAIKRRADLTDERYHNMIERIGRVEVQAGRNSQEFREVWTAIANRIDRQALVDSNTGDDRRLDALERQVEQLRQLLYGGRAGR
jgi:hypothetical protein